MTIDEGRQASVIQLNTGITNGTGLVAISLDKGKYDAAGGRLPLTVQGERLARRVIYRIYRVALYPPRPGQEDGDNLQRALCAPKSTEQLPWQMATRTWWSERRTTSLHRTGQANVGYPPDLLPTQATASPGQKGKLRSLQTGKLFSMEENACSLRGFLELLLSFSCTICERPTKRLICSQSLWTLYYQMACGGKWLYECQVFSSSVAVPARVLHDEISNWQLVVLCLLLKTSDEIHNAK